MQQYDTALPSRHESYMYGLCTQYNIRTMHINTKYTKNYLNNHKSLREKKYCIFIYIRLIHRNLLTKRPTYSSMHNVAVKSICNPYLIVLPMILPANALKDITGKAMDLNVKARNFSRYVEICGTRQNSIIPKVQYTVLSATIIHTQCVWLRMRS